MIGYVWDWQASILNSFFFFFLEKCVCGSSGRYSFPFWRIQVLLAWTSQWLVKTCTNQSIWSTVHHLCFKLVSHSDKVRKWITPWNYLFFSSYNKIENNLEPCHIWYFCLNKWPQWFIVKWIIELINRKWLSGQGSSNMNIVCFSSLIMKIEFGFWLVCQFRICHAGLWKALRHFFTAW